jgi:hypothetical protein
MPQNLDPSTSGIKIFIDRQRAGLFRGLKMSAGLYIVEGKICYWRGWHRNNCHYSAVIFSLFAECQTGFYIDGAGMRT